MTKGNQPPPSCHSEELDDKKLTRQERKAVLQQFVKTWEEIIQTERNAGNINSLEKRKAEMFLSQLLTEAFQLKFQKDFVFEAKINKKDWADALLPGRLLSQPPRA